MMRRSHFRRIDASNTKCIIFMNFSLASDTLGHAAMIDRRPPVLEALLSGPIPHSLYPPGASRVHITAGDDHEEGDRTAVIAGFHLGRGASGFRAGAMPGEDRSCA